MTMEARQDLLDYIASPSTQSSLRAYARRRGLGDQADDLVQNVLCAALAAAAVPERPSELPRFVTGIARNKVVDERRRRGRWRSTELPDDLEAPQSPDARALLKQIDEEIVAPEERRALSWLVREHAGDSLYLLALEQSLEPATLRQRVSRLRRSLRKRYGAVLAVVLALAGGASAWHAHVGPLNDAPAVAPANLAKFAGTWRVVGVAPARYRDLVQTVEISGERAILHGSGTTKELTISGFDGQRVTLSMSAASWTVRVEEVSASRLRLSGPRGSVELER